MRGQRQGPCVRDGAQEYGEYQQSRTREGTHTRNGGAELPMVMPFYFPDSVDRNIPP